MCEHKCRHDSRSLTSGCWFLVFSCRFGTRIAGSINRNQAAEPRNICRNPNIQNQKVQSTVTCIRDNSRKFADKNLSQRRKEAKYNPGQSASSAFIHFPIHSCLQQAGAQFATIHKFANTKSNSLKFNKQDIRHVY